MVRVEKESNVTAQLEQWIRSESYTEDDISALKALMEGHPSFSLLHVLYLRMIYLCRREAYPEALRQHTAYIPDHKQFLRHLNRLALSDDPPEETQKRDLFDIIFPTCDSPVMEFVGDDERSLAEETSPVVELLEFLPSYPVYRIEDTTMEGEKTTEKKHHRFLIEKFIETEPAMPKEGTPINFSQKESPEETDENEEFFSEILAQIYIKQKLYHKAIATYLKLSLKYPEKSIYFAHLIKKTKDLINNNTD